MIKAKHERMYMDMAIAASKSSTAKRAQVGCVIVTTGDIVLPGYNGTPRGWNNLCEGNTNLGISFTLSEVLHAESNAISKAAREGISCKGASIFTTHAPCMECAKLIHQVGICKVFFIEPYRHKSGMHFLNKCEIFTKQVDGYDL